MKKKIIHLSSFKNIGVLHTAFKSFFELLSQNFDEIIIVNIDNLQLFSKKNIQYSNYKIRKKFPKKVKFFNPKNFQQLKDKLDFKNSVLINNLVSTFENYKILRFIKKANVPQVVVANLGNVQGSSFYFWKKNFNYYVKNFTTHLPKKLAVILSSIGFFSKIDIRFTSNKKIFNSFVKNKKKFFRKPTIYKEMILAKSLTFDKIKKDNLSEKYITLLDYDPDYDEMVQETGKLNQLIKKKHYLSSKIFLKKLSKVFKKKVVICIHPKYNLKKISKIYNEFEVRKFKTKYFIDRSFVVLFYDSSSIVEAIFNKKKIISLKSDLYKGKKDMTNIYTDIVPFRSINISNDKIILNKNRLIKELNSKISIYDKYLNDYGSNNLNEIGSQKIIDIIKLRYFEKKSNSGVLKQ